MTETMRYVGTKPTIISRREAIEYLRHDYENAEGENVASCLEWLADILEHGESAIGGKPWSEMTDEALQDRINSENESNGDPSRFIVSGELI